MLRAACATSLLYPHHLLSHGDEAVESRRAGLGGACKLLQTTLHCPRHRLVGTTQVLCPPLSMLDQAHKSQVLGPRYVGDGLHSHTARVLLTCVHPAIITQPASPLAISCQPALLACLARQDTVSRGAPAARGKRVGASTELAAPGSARAPVPPAPGCTAGLDCRWPLPALPRLVISPPEAGSILLLEQQ